MIRTQITAPNLTTYQKAIINSKARFTVCEASTKVGKTFSHMWWLFKLAHSGKPGYNYWWVAPYYSAAEIAFNRIRRKVANNPLYTVNLSKLTIITPKATIITFQSAEKPDTLYGEDCYGAVFDEFTRAREEAWFALRSTLTATRAPCKFIGNVKGRGWGYRLALRAKTEPGFEHFKITAYDAVAAGILDLEEVESAKRDLPDHVFRELYLAEPSDDGGNPFGIQHIANCVTPLSTKAPTCYGIDLAKSYDYTCIIGLDSDGRVCHLSRFQMDWGNTQSRIESLLHVPAAIDSTGVGDPIVEALQRKRPNVESFKFTQASKQQLMEGLAVAIQNRQIGFPAGIIKDELEAFEYEYTRTGVRYAAADGTHDDTVCALALAWHKFKRGQTRMMTIKPSSSNR